jgi:hypothetical protein
MPYAPEGKVRMAREPTEEDGMPDVPRMSAEEAHRRTASGEAMLVCAYDSEEKCSRVPLEGSVTLAELQRRGDSLPKDRPLIFYCA